VVRAVDVRAEVAEQVEEPEVGDVAALDRAQLVVAVRRVAGPAGVLEADLVGKPDEVQLVPLQGMLPRFRRAKSKPGKDAGSANSRTIGATEDAARRSFAAAGSDRPYSLKGHYTSLFSRP
jgi:hypothetical protein